MPPADPYEIINSNDGNTSSESYISVKNNKKINEIIKYKIKVELVRLEAQAQEPPLPSLTACDNDQKKRNPNQDSRSSRR